MVKQEISKITVLVLLIITILVSVFSTSVIIRKYQFMQPQINPVASSPNAEGSIRIMITEQPKPEEPLAQGQIKLKIV